MPASIKFDSTEILSTTYVPRFAKHESIPERLINSMILAREDGEVLISTSYGKKTIKLQGILTGTSQADLESKIDIFKELFSRPEKNLDLDWNGATLRFVATCSKHDFDRDHFNIKFVPWTAEFVILSGEGKDTADTTALNAHSVTTTTPGADSFTLLGSKPPKPVITLTNGWKSTAVGFEYKNTDTGEKIVVIINRSWQTLDTIIIDCYQKKVFDNASGTPVEIPFYGVFPQFKIGTNNIQITNGSIINQSTSDTLASALGNSGNIQDNQTRWTQQFSVAYSDDSFRAITLVLKKTGAPSQPLTVRVETDNNGQASGTLAHANATLTIAAANIGTVRDYVTGYAANNWHLDANTKYWIVVEVTSGVDASNYYSISFNNDNLYSRGGAKHSFDAGASYTADVRNLAFRMLYGGSGNQAGGIAHTVVYKKTYL